MRKGRRQVLKGGDEYDAATGWRKVIIWGRGKLKLVKRKMNKRYRKEAKSEIKRNVGDD